MTKSRRFTLSISDLIKKYNLAHFERGRDGSFYMMPAINNDIGLHLSYHASGIAHIATRTPMASARFCQEDLIRDILTKKQFLFDNNVLVQLSENSGIITIIKSDKLFSKFPTFTPRSLNIDYKNITDSTILATTDNMSYALDYLRNQRGIINNTDMVLIQDLNDKNITFFAPPLHSNLRSLRGITIDPCDISSISKLPGVAPLIPQIKELSRKIDDIPKITSNQIKNNNVLSDFVNRLPWRIVSINSRKL
ncbi:MAG TPA: hypothetical protein VH500_17410 [Nitrososphaeraceae archaeon]|jgi:hypothetical protein